MDVAWLEYELKLQKDNLNVLQECLKKINIAIQNTDYIVNSNEVTELLKDVKNNLDYSKNSIASLEKLKSLASTQSYSTSYDFTTLYETCRNLSETSSIKLNEFLIKYIKSTSFFVDSSKANDTIPSDLTNFNISNYSDEQEGSNFTGNELIDKLTGKTYHDNNVLLISEKKNKVFLPYTIRDLNKIIEKSKTHRTIQEIIDKKYTISLNKYKSAIISRFRETYNLMKKREKATIADSLDFALELAFNSKLNPAIITACKNLEQLEAYLDCLELNELSKFDYFEIKYEFALAKR